MVKYFGVKYYVPKLGTISCEEKSQGFMAIRKKNNKQECEQKRGAWEQGRWCDVYRSQTQLCELSSATSTLTAAIYFQPLKALVELLYSGGTTERLIVVVGTADESKRKRKEVK